MVGMPVSLPFTEADIRLAADAIGIAREAIGLFTEACQFVDDVSGLAGDAANELLAVHLRACQAAPPGPVAIGGYLAGLMLDDEYVFEPDLDDYAELLGDQGAAVVRGRIATAYAENPASWRARYLRESIARAEGDVDTVVAIYAAELDDHGRNQRRDRFMAERTLASYQTLREAATASGVWPAEREKALALLSEDKRVWPRQPAWAWSGPVLIDALIDDRDLDAAWAAAKNAASERQWLRLADASTDSHPADALAVYRTTIGSLKVHTGDDNYRRIAGLLLSARACHLALGTPDEFTRYVAALRVEQKRKRNLMRILDQNGL